MPVFVTLLIVALAVSAIGFKKYVWFISIGYGFAILAIGVALLVIFRGSIDAGLIAACVLFILYGARLGGYLAYRELKSGSYNRKMKTEIKDGKGLSVGAKLAIWISAALLYFCETSPLVSRMQVGAADDVFLTVGLIVMALGLILESAADCGAFGKAIT